MIWFQLVEFQSAAFHEAPVPLVEVEFHDAPFQLAPFQLAPFHEALFHEALFQFDAIVPLVRHVVLGAQTSAGTPWFARLGFEAPIDVSRASAGVRDDVTERDLETSAHLTLSGLQVGFFCSRSAAAAAT